MWTFEESMFWTFLILGGFAALGAVGAWVCDWLEKKFSGRGQ
jgi:hypothetical protein